jgi:hypothetical protein
LVLLSTVYASARAVPFLCFVQVESLHAGMPRENEHISPTATAKSSLQQRYHWHYADRARIQES